MKSSRGYAVIWNQRRVPWLIAVAMLFITSFQVVVAAPPATSRDAKSLESDNQQLKTVVAQLNKENADLRAENARIKDALAKAGIQIPTSQQVIQSTTKAATTQVATDPNTAVAKAFQTYAVIVTGIKGSSDTDIQKRQKWLGAAKDLGDVLAKNRVTISYTISNVSFSQSTGTASIIYSSAVISSNDQQVPDVALTKPLSQLISRLTIQTDETAAGKISTKSPMTLEGFIRLGILDKPAAAQPAYANQIAGYTPVGEIKDLVLNFASNTNVTHPPFFIQNNAVLRIDGLVRKMTIK